jgi:pectinacetylesterase
MNYTKWFLFASLLVAGCNGSNGLGTGGDLAGPALGDLAMAPAADLARPPLGMPITAQPNQWTWVDFPESSCDDGTPTGIGVNPGDAKKLVVFLMGGGACWDYTTCVSLSTSVHGPFGASQFNTLQAQLGGSIFDRTLATNPFKDWSFVFVPYCTGDLHGGDNVATYTANGDTRMFHHKGYANMKAYVPRIAATWPATDKLVVSGSSAGGYGAGINYDLVRTSLPGGEGYMIDDSGPPLKSSDFPMGFRDAFYMSWNLGASLDGICPTCRQDFSNLIPVLGNKYPKDRGALLSSLQDRTISGYLLLSGPGFQTALLDLATTVIDPQPNFRYFLINGNSHTMLGAPGDARYTSQNVQLLTWLPQMVNDDPAWKSLKP